MLIPRDLRTIDKPRDWARPWRDAPGFFGPGWRNCNCCEPCNSSCNSCATQVWADDFTSSLGGYTSSLCATGRNFAVTGGSLVENYNGPPYTGAGGAYTQSITRPALNGLCISVCASIKILSLKSAGGTGVTIGSGPEFHLSVSGIWVLQRAACSAAGCITAGATDTGLHTWVSGDVITLKLSDTSSGGGTYKAECYINGSLVNTRTGLAYTIPDPFIAGVDDTNGGEWGCLRIATN